MADIPNDRLCQNCGEEFEMFEISIRIDIRQEACGEDGHVWAPSPVSVRYHERCWKDGGPIPVTKAELPGWPPKRAPHEYNWMYMPYD